MPDTESQFKCDFCGTETDWVARVAIAPGYDRLYAAPKYACKDCHSKKEFDREAGKKTDEHTAQS